MTINEFESLQINNVFFSEIIKKQVKNHNKIEYNDKKISIKRKDENIKSNLKNKNEKSRDVRDICLEEWNTIDLNFELAEQEIFEEFSLSVENSI